VGLVTDRPWLASQLAPSADVSFAYADNSTAIHDTFTADSAIINASGAPGHKESPSTPVSGGTYAQWSADGFYSTYLFPARGQTRGVPPSLGLPVSSRQFSWKEMVIRAWGSEFSAPDRRAYEFSSGRGFDSTDRGDTGLYEPPVT
jgi:hypothetical protein